MPTLIRFEPQLLIGDPTPPPSSCFWSDLVGCSNDCSDMPPPSAPLLTKDAQLTFHPGLPSRDYRPYSRTCPPPTPPKRWVTKTICGTYSIYGFGAYDATGKAITVNRTIYSLPGMPDTSTTVPAYDPSKPTTQPQLIGSGPYCTKVTVYE